MNLELTLTMKPGYTLANGRTKLVRQFRISLFNDGECLRFDDNTRLWNPAPDFTNSRTCNAESNPATGSLYTWVYIPLPNSKKGTCEARNPDNTWGLTDAVRGLDKLACEKKMATDPENVRWYSLRNWPPVMT